jgi:hypothetical protein
MADIKYTPVFKHEDWIDNEDLVQASGDRGFNKKFHDLEDELTSISTVVGTVDTEIKKIQRLNFLTAPPSVTLGANSTSQEFPVEQYDRTTMPANVERVYFAVILPLNGPKNIQHTFLYQSGGPNKIVVTVLFTNPGAAQASFNFRIMALATQS